MGSIQQTECCHSHPHNKKNLNKLKIGVFSWILWIFKRAEVTEKNPQICWDTSWGHSPEWRVIKSPLCPRQGVGKGDSCGICPSCLYNLGPISEEKIVSEVNSTWRWILLPFQPPLQVLSYPRNPQLWHWRSQPGDTGRAEQGLVKGHRTLSFTPTVTPLQLGSGTITVV